MRISRRKFAGGLAGTALGTPAGLAQAGSSPPNILFLVSDDHSAPDVGCYGSKAARTPRLDRLAGQGMRFTQAFAAAPQCSPSRSSYYSGCTPHTIGTSRQASFYPDVEPSIVEALREKGYYTCAYGKVHQGASFERRFDFHSAEIDAFGEFFQKRPDNKPFFAQVGFSDPHRPYQQGSFSPPTKAEDVHVPDFFPDTPAVRQDLALYYDEIARLDAKTGEFLDLLDRHGLAENTLVIFTSDHGMPFPRAKGTLYEAGVRVPLIVRWPGRIQAGAVSEALVSGVDLAPTWLDLARAPNPPKMQGRSLLGVLEGRERLIREAVFAERNWHNHSDPMRCARTSRYKLIYNGRPEQPYRPTSDSAASPTWRSYLAESNSRRSSLKAHHWRLLAPSRPFLEFYDLKNDPNEFHNRAEDPAYEDERTRLEMLLSDWMHETLDFLPPLYYGYPAREHPGRRLTV